MAKPSKSKKSPSRNRYEEEHPTISGRVDKETKRHLKEHLEAAGCSYGEFIKDALGKEKSMVEERVAKLASRRVEESKAPTRDLELYGLVLDLAYWTLVLWMNQPDLLDVPCPDCRFPSRLSGKEGRTVMLEMVESGDFKCPECGLILKNPPQLAWVLLVSKVAEEVRREKLKFLRPKEKQAKDQGERT